MKTEHRIRESERERERAREMKDSSKASSCCSLSCGGSSSPSSSSVVVVFWVVALLVLAISLVCVLSPTKATDWVPVNFKQYWVAESGINKTSTGALSSALSASIHGVDDDEQRSIEGLESVQVATSTDELIKGSTAVQMQNPVQINNVSLKANNVTSDVRKNPREHTKLEKLEVGLARARKSIQQAIHVGSKASDADYVPEGPIYRNALAFHRSYLEMEKQLKVFVYEEGEPPLFHNGPCKSIYSMEGNFINNLEVGGGLRTRDPDNAHVFFLPFSITMMVQFVYEKNSHDFNLIKQTVADYVDVIARKHPYWNRSLGADHFMLSCHDWGPVTSSYIPDMYKNSIRALCNANTSEGFNPSKDVSFPEINLRNGDTKGFIGGPSASHRPILAFFAGGLHGPIRPILLEHWENKDDDIQVHRYLRRGVSYYEMMRKSKYCICPSGYEVASPRIVEAIYSGCVPVLISDNYVLPFSDVLNWKSFSVEVPVDRIPDLKKILMGISSRQYIRMQRRGVQVRRHFEVNSPPKRFDVFYMILHSVWLRRLNVRVRD